jgi:hypothetical protein
VANPAYEQTGTALNEIAHTVGVGTNWFWAQLIVNGVCKGTSTNRMLQFMTRNPNAVINEDGSHFWPFWVNESWEDTGNDLEQGMKKDGLPTNQAKRV